MHREERTEVLVVGAGPVGMLTALQLARNAIGLRVIDQEYRTASRTYACALHPHTLKLLDPLGISRAAMAAGRIIETVAFYQGASRRAEVKLSHLPVDFPFLVVLAQSEFERILEEKLRKDGGVPVQWNHQLSGLHSDGESIVAVVDQLGISAKGYAVPEMDWSVQRTQQIRADYLIGADGPNSFVAHELQLGDEHLGQSETYEVFEFSADWECADELRIVLDDKTTSVLWPLAGERFRWSFQIPQEHIAEFPAKERKPLQIGNPELDRRDREAMRKLIQQRAPWFTAEIREVFWSTEVEFPRKVAKNFGRGRTWLVGDAAHQTSPAAMQSMNLGVIEAEQLAASITQILRHHGPGTLLTEYDQASHARWQTLLNGGASIVARPEATPWVKAAASRILPCLPGSGDDLVRLLAQLQLGFA